MGTRGLFGFRKDGKDKAVYRHYDSYPEGLGTEFVEFILKNKEKLPELFDRIIEVEGEPTEDQIFYCGYMGWTDLSVSERSVHDWYCLLHDLQYPENWQKAVDKGEVIYIENDIDFIKDSLFCEYAYIYDIDYDEIEIYFGFTKEPDEYNRYGTKRTDSGYYPCKLIYEGKVTDYVLDQFIRI